MADKERLRLLVVGSSWPPETFLGRLMRGLAESGIDVLIAFSYKPDQDWFYEFGLRSLMTRNWEGPRLRRLLRIARLGMRALIRSPRDLRLFLSASRREKGLRNRFRMFNRLLPFAGIDFDVLYFPWISAAIDYMPLFKKGHPAVVSCRGSQVLVAPHDPRWGISAGGLPIVFARAAAIHCVSGAIEREAEHFGLDRSKSRVIHPGIAPDFFTPSAERERASFLRIVTVGRLVWVKGLTYALQSLRLLLDRGVASRLTIVGDGPERQRILFTIDDLGLRDHVELAGRLPPMEVRDRLRQADVFLLPSLSEGFCNAAIEAMSCGVPVVITNCGGTREGVTDGVEGFIVPSRDPHAAADALQKLASDPKLRDRMGRAARARVFQQFTLSRHVGEFKTLFEEVRRCGVA